MAKLSFRYGAMNSGKTTMLIQVAYNYEERDQKVLLIKPQIDTKGAEKIVSRVGLERKVDHLIKKDDLISNLNLDGITAILVDEAQFLTPNQIDELWFIAKKKNVTVICYGLKIDFRTYGFPGSIRLMELADELIELPTICFCGVKARFIGRKVNGEYVNDGEQVVIDGAENVEYISLCSKCYIEKVKRC